MQLSACCKVERYVASYRVFCLATHCRKPRRELYALLFRACQYDAKLKLELPWKRSAKKNTVSVKSRVGAGKGRGGRGRGRAKPTRPDHLSCTTDMLLLCSVYVTVSLFMKMPTEMYMCSCIESIGRLRTTPSSFPAAPWAFAEPHRVGRSVGVRQETYLGGRMHALITHSEGVHRMLRR